MDAQGRLFMDFFTNSGPWEPMTKRLSLLVPVAAAALFALGASHGLGAAPEHAAAAPAADGLPVQPGYWDTHLSALLLSGRDRRCIHAAEVARFVGGPQNHIYTCRYPTSVVENGHLTWIGYCDSRGGSHIDLNATGTYTRTSLTAHGTVRTHVLGVPVSANFSIRSTRLGECEDFPSAPVINRQR